MADEADNDELRVQLNELDPTMRTLVAEADLGRQAREFMSSDLGRHLVGCLHQEIVIAQERLEGVAFWRWRRIIQLQTSIWRAKFMLSWLRDLLIAGKAAEISITSMEKTND